MRPPRNFSHGTCVLGPSTYKDAYVYAERNDTEIVLAVMSNRGCLDRIVLDTNARIMLTAWIEYLQGIDGLLEQETPP
jgi:hypothetical protein